MNRRISDALGPRDRDSLRHYQMVTQGRPFWPIDWRYIWFVVREIAWCGDSMQIRALMATVSLGWAAQLLTESTILAGPNYAVMRLVPSWAWVAAFCLHGIGGWWRIIERRPRVKTAFVINFVGVMVWFAATSAICWSAGRVVIGSTLEWFAIGLLICATINTGRNEERGTP